MKLFQRVVELPPMMIALGLLSLGMALDMLDRDIALLFFGASLILSSAGLACLVLHRYIRLYRAERELWRQALDHTQTAIRISNATAQPLPDVMDALLRARNEL